MTLLQDGQFKLPPQLISMPVGTRVPRPGRGVGYRMNAGSSKLVMKICVYFWGSIWQPITEV